MSYKYVERKKLRKFLERIEKTKGILEKCYFEFLHLLNKAIEVTQEEEKIDLLHRQKAELDDVTNETISFLDRLSIQIEQYYNRLKQEGLLEPKSVSQILKQTDEYFPNEEEALIKAARNIPEYQEFSDEDLSNDLKALEALQNSNKGEFEEALDEINLHHSYETTPDVRQGLLLRDLEYDYDSKINEVTKAFNEQIELLNQKNDFLEKQTESIWADLLRFKAPNDEKTDQERKDLYYQGLDNSLNTIVSQLDNVSSKLALTFNSLSLEHVDNLEKLSLPLIKTLEVMLFNLTTDLNDLRKQNHTYQDHLNKYKDIIHDLKEEKLKKEQELDLSYKSWFEANKKINELEIMLKNQSEEINTLHYEKNEMINYLEKKINDTTSYLDQVNTEKTTLAIEKQSLLERIKDINEHREYAENQYHSTIDQYVDAVSIQDIVNKESNKILDQKVKSLIGTYEEEIEKIKSKTISEIIDASHVQAPSPYDELFDDFVEKQAQSQGTSILEKIDHFADKIAGLEEKLKENEKMKVATEQSLQDFSSLVSNPPYTLVDKEKKALIEKYDQLDEMIQYSLEKVKEFEDFKNQLTQKERLDADFDEKVLNSAQYQALSEELNKKQIEIDNLKQDNLRISEESILVNELANDLLQKLQENSSKVDDIEKLLVQQEYEYLILDEEKNKIIQSLTNAFKKKDSSELDEISNIAALNKYDFINKAKNAVDYTSGISDTSALESLKKQVQTIIDNEVSILKDKYETKINEINQKYEEAAEKANKPQYASFGDILDTNSVLTNALYKNIVDKDYKKLEETNTSLENRIKELEQIILKKDLSSIKQNNDSYLNDLLKKEKAEFEQALNEKTQQEKSVQQELDLQKQYLSEEIIASTNTLLDLQQKMLSLEKHLLSEEQDLINGL